MINVLKKNFPDQTLIATVDEDILPVVSLLKWYQFSYRGVTMARTQLGNDRTGRIAIFLHQLAVLLYTTPTDRWSVILTPLYSRNPTQLRGILSTLPRIKPKSPDFLCATRQNLTPS